MTTKGTILLADDEATFADSTSALLQREGFECETVPDGATALERAATGRFDLLISDLEMPGNADLDLVRKIGQVHGGLPMIIVTGFPSVRSAVACIELPVAAYLVKPVPFRDLLVRVEEAVARFRSYRVIESAERRLGQWRQEFEHVAATRQGTALPAPAVDAFLALTLRNVMGSLTDLEHLNRALSGRSGAEAQHPCQLLNCPRGAQLLAALQETIGVLEETKATFKSKQLGDLRHRLELLVDFV